MMSTLTHRSTDSSLDRLDHRHRIQRVPRVNLGEKIGRRESSTDTVHVHLQKLSRASGTSVLPKVLSDQQVSSSVTVVIYLDNKLTIKKLTCDLIIIGTRANAWQERLDSGEFPPGTRPDISVIDSQYRQNQGQVDLRSESHLTDEMVEFIIDAFETRYHNLRLRLVEFGLNLEIYDNMDRSTGLPRNHPGARPQLPNEQRPRPPQLHNGPYQMSRASTAELLSPVTEHPEEGPGLCSICLNRMYRLHPINETDRPVRLPCGHAFHTGCILTWWQRTPNNPGCPYCRRIYQIRWE